MKFKKIITIMLLVTLLINSIIPLTAFAEADNNEDKQEIFYDDFSGESLDTSKWLIAKKAWGGNNGGVVPENVSVSDGILKLEGHGDYYTGDISGINREDGTRTGAAIATREYFASGSYEVVAKVAPELGACSAIWTFEYEEYYPGDEKYEELGATGSYYAVNHEIDIEMPGRASNGASPSYEYALCNTWIGEKSKEYTTSYTKLPYAQNDGKFHKYRFDWHTGDSGEEPRVEFYFDDELITTNYTHIPTNEGRLWIGLWFPNGWAGTPKFDTAVFEIDYVKIIPFNEAGDTPQNETYGKDGWAEDSFPEDKITSKQYNIGKNYITRISANTTVKEFIKNVETENILIFTDKNKNVLNENDLIKTGVKLKVGSILNYELVVNGDIDGDGLITINDLAKLKLHLIDKNILMGSYLKSADSDNNDMVNINDLAKLKLILIS